jgi:hypothetical protein
MVVLVTLLAVVVALLALLVAGLLRSHAEIIRALHELGADLDPDSRGRAATLSVPPTRADGRSATDVAGESPIGDAVNVGVAGSPDPTLLAFLTSGCLTCAGFWEAFARPERLVVPGDARLVVVTKSGGNESVSKLRDLAPETVPVVMSSEAWEAYDVPVAPYFVYVDGPSGQVLGEGAASTWEQVVSLLSQALDDAGLESGGRSRRHRRRRSRGDAPREARADRDLLAAGIHPGHPSLFPRSEDDLRQEHGQAEGQGEAHEP